MRKSPLYSRVFNIRTGLLYFPATYFLSTWPYSRHMLINFKKISYNTLFSILKLFLICNQDTIPGKYYTSSKYQEKMKTEVDYWGHQQVYSSQNSYWNFKKFPSNMFIPTSMFIWFKEIFRQTCLFQTTLIFKTLE